MPLYEYQCGACGHRFETIQKFSDPPLETCPKCGGPVAKLQSAPAFQFKGSGWYITDYARKDAGASGGDTAKESGAKSGTAGDGQAAKPDGGSAAKSEAKAEPKTPTSPPKSDGGSPKAG